MKSRIVFLLSLICVGLTVHAWEPPNVQALLTNVADRVQKVASTATTQAQDFASNAIDKAKQLPADVVTVVSLLENAQEQIVNVFAVWKEPINKLLDQHQEKAEDWIVKLVILKHPHLATINNYSVGNAALRWMVRRSIQKRRKDIHVYIGRFLRLIIKKLRKKTQRSRFCFPP
jgi:hypothetical protein